MSSRVAPGSVVDAVTSRGLSPVIVEHVNGDSFTGLLVSARNVAQVFGPHNGLIDEIIDTRSERVCIIRSADDETVGILILHDETGVMLYHLDDGARIAPAKSPQGALKIASRTLAQYSRAAVEEGRDWSATEKQSVALLAQERIFAPVMAQQLAWTGY